MNDKKPWWKGKKSTDLDEAVAGWLFAIMGWGMFALVMTIGDAQLWKTEFVFHYLWLGFLFLSLLKFGMMLERRYGQSEKKEG